MSDTSTNIPVIKLKEQSLPSDTTTILTSERSIISSFSGDEFLTRGATALAPIPIDRLYEGVRGTSSQILYALELLKELCENLAAALRSDDPIEADSFVQRVQLALPNLFSCRSIGDGFGLLVNSLYFALVNLQGTPLTKDQINVIWRAMRELRSRPVMLLDQAIRYAEEFEMQGLEVDPPDLGNVAELFESTENA
jgi:hypothetical protein